MFNYFFQLLGWFEEKLPDIGKLPSEVQSLVPLLFACLEDRSADVRKKAQVVLPLLMVPVGYDVMLKHTGKLKVALKQSDKYCYYFFVYSLPLNKLLKLYLINIVHQYQLYQQNHQHPVKRRPHPQKAQQRKVQLLLKVNLLLSLVLKPLEARMLMKKMKVQY